MEDISPDLIKSQLERILASPEFMASKMLSRFLHYVVEQNLNGQSDSIKQYTVAVEALGYGADFDPQSNSNVRIQARKLRRALDRYYYGEGIEDPIRIDIPTGSYVPVFTNRATAWSPTVESESSPISGQLPRELQPLTIAVVQFGHLSNQENDALIAVGITSEIIVSLTRFSELTVLGPLVPEKGGRVNFREMLREYSAGFVLQGWIRTSGSKIRISVDLLDTSTGYSLWARTLEYDLDTTSLFEIEDEVTGQVAGVIGDGIGIPFHRLHSESYMEHIKLHDVTEAVLAHNYYWTKITAWDWRRANDAVGEALVKHPDSALLNALQSNLYYGDVVHCMDIFPNSVSKMEELGDRAIDIDPELQVAQYNRVTLSAFFGRIEECVATARKVVEMNPNQARILAGSAVATTTVGAYDLGKTLIEKAKRLNPQYPGWYMFVDFLINFHKGQYEEALANARLIETPGLLWEPLFRVATLGILGRVDEAQPFVEQLLQTRPAFRELAHDYVRRLFITDEHVDMILDGLRKGGIGRI